MKGKKEMKEGEENILKMMETNTNFRDGKKKWQPS